MKKALSVLLAFMMLMSFAACTLSSHTITDRIQNGNGWETNPGAQSGNVPEITDSNSVKDPDIIKEPENQDPYVTAPDDTKLETTDEEKFDAVTNAVDSYYAAVISLDVNKALSFTKENSEAYTSVVETGKGLDFSTIYDSVPSSLKSAEMTRVIDGFVEEVKDIIAERASHAVRKISITNDTDAKVVVEESVPTIESISNIDFSQLLDEDKIVSYFLNSLTDAEYDRFLQMNEVQATSVMANKMPAVMEKFFDDCVIALKRQIRTEQSVSVYNLSKVNGKWLIVSVEEGELE